MPDQHMRGMMGDPRPPQMDSQIPGDPFPNLVRDRDQLSNLWIHIAQVLSDGVRQRAMQEGQGTSPAGLPPMSEFAGSDVSDFEMESRMSAGEIGAPEKASAFRQLPDPATKAGNAMPATDIARVAYEAGFRGEALATMVAIALSESSGNPRAHNPVGRDNSYGLWQINMLGGMGESRRKQFGLQSDEDLWDPATNARVAYALVQGRRGGFQDWSDYTNGRYLRYWQVASQAANAAEAAAGGVR